MPEQDPEESAVFHNLGLRQERHRAPSLCENQMASQREDIIQEHFIPLLQKLLDFYEDCARVCTPDLDCRKHWWIQNHGGETLENKVWYETSDLPRYIKVKPEVLVYITDLKKSGKLTYFPACYMDVFDDSQISLSNLTEAGLGYLPILVTYCVISILNRPPDRPFCEEEMLACGSPGGAWSLDSKRYGDACDGNFNAGVQYMKLLREYNSKLNQAGKYAIEFETTISSPML